MITGWEPVWKGDGAEGVWYGAAAEIRVVSVTSLLAWAVTISAMFTRTDILAHRFSLCSVSVKIALFRSFCICFYGMELWSCYTACAINRLRSCYIKCMKTFFKYSKYYSVTSMLLELGLPSFDTLIINSRVNLTRQLHCSNNSVIRQLCQNLGLHVI